MTASGSISGATGTIQFILTDLRCADAASTYYCETLYLTGSAGTDEATANITARTYPEQIEMYSTPDRAEYDNGQLISIRCTGRIGNQFDENNLQNLWTWERLSTDNESTSWTRYPNSSNITYDTPAPVSGSGDCQYTGETTLVHTVSDDDNGIQFRCSVIATDYSANKTVFVRGPPTTTTTMQSSTDSTTVTDEKDTTTIANTSSTGVTVEKNTATIASVSLLLSICFR
ncbi:uncharacterized protein LOC124256795 isoform X2 [Haliotis rubra]|uniref:uncharacterized protein LOC124256795 isoform X2 n=1 Tax=Haliotis rubra TaxID=36100 RepID=UPI001EE53FFB|nr:uncharacterized protein LOC124256795 isoform X2 [Haliotis rubra]